MYNRLYQKLINYLACRPCIGKSPQRFERHCFWGQNVYIWQLSCQLFPKFRKNFLSNWFLCHCHWLKLRKIYGYMKYQYCFVHKKSWFVSSEKHVPCQLRSKTSYGNLMTCNSFGRLFYTEQSFMQLYTIELLMAVCRSYELTASRVARES